MLFLTYRGPDSVSLKVSRFGVEVLRSAGKVHTLDKIIVWLALFAVLCHPRRSGLEPNDDPGYAVRLPRL